MANDLKDRSPKEDNPIQKHYDSEFDNLTSGEHMSRDGTPSTLSNKSDKKPEDSNKTVNLGDAEKKSTELKGENSGLYSATPSPTGKKGLGKFATKKRAGIFGGVTGIIIVLAVYTFSIISGPFQFIHISQLLGRNWDSLDLMSQERTGAHLRSYAWGGKNAYVGSRLGFIGNRMANGIETNLNKNGIELVYTQDLGVLTGVKVDGEFVAQFDGADSNKFRRDMTKSVISERMGWNKTTTALKTRLPFKRYDVSLRVLGNLQRRTDERLQDWYNRLREDRSRRLTDTSFDFDATREKRAELEAKVADGVDLTPDEQRLLADLQNSGSDVDAITKEALDEYESTPGDHTAKMEAAAAKFDAAAKAAGGASVIAMVLALSCLIDSLTEKEKTAFFENVYLPLLRAGGEAMSVGSQVMLGEAVDIDELALNNEFLYDDVNDTSWSNSEGFGGSEPIPTEYKADSQETPTVLRVLSGLEQSLDFNGIGKLTEIDIVCSVAGNPWTGWGLFVVEVGAAILSGGGTLLSVPAVNRAASLFVKEVIGDVVAGRAINAGSSFVLASMIGKVVPPLARGALYGSIISMGSHYASNEAGRAVGGVSLTDEQTNTLEAHLNQLRIDNANEKGFAYKYLDSSNPASITASVLSSLAGKSFGKIIFNVASFVLKPFANIGGIFQSALAADDGNFSVNYGADKISFGMEEIYSEDPRVQDPFVAEKYVIDNNLKDKYEGCFKSPVESFRDGNFDELDDFHLSPMPNLGNCDYPENAQEEYDFMIYRINYFDEQNLLSVACLEGDDESCVELGV